MDTNNRLEHKRQANDPALAEMLVNQFYELIYRLAQSILQDADEAEDAAQETILRALRAWQSFEPGSNLRGWLFTIAIRLCQDRLRRRQARERLDNVLQRLHLASHKPPSPEEMLIESEQQQALWKAVHTLDEKHRLPLILRFVHGMTTPEIAEALKVPEGTVYSRLHTAFNRIEKVLGSMEGWER